MKKKHCNCIISFLGSNDQLEYGSIAIFCSVRSVTNLAVVNVYDIGPAAFSNRETTAQTRLLKSIIRDNSIVKVIPVDSILSKCFRVLNVLCILPNEYECNL